MKKIPILFLGLLGGLAACTRIPPAIAPDKKIETRIGELLQKMTLEEKIGQMCQLTAGVVIDQSDPQHPVLSEALLDTVIGRYKVGSILNIPFGVGRPREVWIRFINRIQQRSLDELGIPCIYGVDQIHGASYTQGATLFPQGINMGASFNRGLMRRCSEISAYETRACAIPWTFAPVMDLGRDPRWPRMWESYGEDTYVNSQMAVASVLGFQGEDPNRVDDRHVAACIKHFMAYGVPVSGKDRTPSSVTRNVLREKYFAPFMECIRAGALSLMVNSASNGGMPFHADRELLTGWIKEELDWDGLIVTDWNDIYNLCERDHIAASRKDAVRIAVNAGIDMSMVPSSWDFCIYLRELVEEGQVSMERIDDAVSRVLRLKFRLGLFENRFGIPAISRNSPATNMPPWHCRLPWSRRYCSRTRTACCRWSGLHGFCSRGRMPIRCAASTEDGRIRGRATAAMNLPEITIPSMRLYAINSTMWTMSPVWSMRRPAMTTGRKNA